MGRAKRRGTPEERRAKALQEREEMIQRRVEYLEQTADQIDDPEVNKIRARAKKELNQLRGGAVILRG